MTEAKLDITDELLVAYVDDELDARQRDMVATVLSGNPSLGRRADEMRLARDLLNEAFPLQPNAEVPAAIDAAANRLAEARARQPSPQTATPRFRYWRKYAIAAGVVLCLAASVNKQHKQKKPETTQAQIDRGTPLFSVLESTPSAEVFNVPAEHAALRAVLTFRAKDGRYCREFEILAGSKGSAGVACRDRGEWHTEVLLSASAAPPNSNYYTPAGETDEPAIAQVVDRLMQDDPLGAQEEARILANGWGAAENP